jgi:hypothetical protein
VGLLKQVCILLAVEFGNLVLICVEMVFQYVIEITEQRKFIFTDHPYYFEDAVMVLLPDIGPPFRFVS